MQVGNGTLAERYAQGALEMRSMHDASLLRRAAESVLPRLPDGPLVLLASSEEGCALAAVCAALRADTRTSWERVSFGVPTQARTGANFVVIEPIDAGEGWRRAVLYKYPGARFQVAVSERTPSVVLAA